MKIFAVVLVLMFAATAAWAGLGLPNELSNPGFETGEAWTTSGPVSVQVPYSMVTPFGIPPAPNGGSYAAGVAGESVAFPGGEVSQIVDESQFPGWNPDYNSKIVELDYYYLAVGMADVPMLLNVYLDYMTDNSYPDPASPLYVKQKVATHVGNSNGWQLNEVNVTLPNQPRWLSVDFEFSYFSGTGAILVDNVDLQGKCVPEPSSMFALGSGLIGLVGFALRRRK